MTLTKKTREANLDVLRIVSMLLIILLHSIDHSGVLERAEVGSTGMYFYVRFTYAMCMVCVNIYVMLSGYFMVNAKFRLHKLITLWMEAAFYSFVLKLLFMLAGKETFSLFSLASCFFPILTGRYWFLTIYVGMYLISPFLNILIHAMTKKQHSLLNLCLFGIMSVWVSIHPVIAGMNSGGGWGLAWFAVLYLAAAWLRLYYTPDGKPLKFFAVYFAIPLLMAAAQVVLKAYGNIPGAGTLHTVVGHWFRYDSAPVYIMTVCLFAGFRNVRMQGEKLSKVITFIASLTFGVYLIHAHANVSPWSWEVLDLPEKMDAMTFPLVQMVSVFGIFAICIMIDMVRNAIFKPLERSRLLDTLCKRMESIAVVAYNKFTKCHAYDKTAG